VSCLYTRSDSQFFWLKYRDGSGIMRQVSTGCRVGVSTDVRRAREMKAEKDLEELKGPKASRGANWGWVEGFLSVRYSSQPVTLERYSACWATIKLFLAERQIENPGQFTRKHCFDYVSWRKRPVKSKGKYKACLNTSLLELKVVSIVMHEAVERSLAPANPCTKLGIKRGRQKEKPEITPEQCEKIRDEIKRVGDPQLREMFENSFEIARYQGCRISETRVNPQTDVQIEGGHGQIIFRAKGGKEFGTLLHPKLIPLFTRLKAAGRTETWSAPAGAPRQWASSKWFKFLTRIGLKDCGLTFHSTRVTVVTELARNDVAQSKAKSYVGHSSTIVHRIYQRLRPDDLSDCADAIG